MNKEEVIEYLKLNDEIDIYYKYLLGQDVWYFKNNSTDYSAKYDEFKQFISRKLNIPFNNISIIGSAKTKFSFSPSKNLKEFHNESDFDLIIVSNKLFNEVWLAYRQIAQNEYLKNYLSIAQNIFNNFVSLKDSDPTYGNEILSAWQRTVLDFKAELQFTFQITHEINYRIYRDWESVQDYHIKGITKLKKALL